METVHGVVMEVNQGSVIVYTEHGEFREVRIRPQPVVGEAVELPGPPRFTLSRRAAVAAAALLILVGGLLSPWAGLVPVVASQVIVDSDASVQLSLDQHNRVVRAVPLNAKGRKFIAGYEVRGRNLFDTINQLATVTSRGRNVLMVGVLPQARRKPALTAETIRASLHPRLTRRNYEGYLVVNQVDRATQQEAGRYGLSANRYLLLADSQRRGIALPPAAVREEPVGVVVADGRIPVEQTFQRGCWFMRGMTQRPAGAIAGSTTGTSAGPSAATPVQPRSAAPTATNAPPASATQPDSGAASPSAIQPPAGPWPGMGMRGPGQWGPNRWCWPNPVGPAANPQE